MNKKQKDAGHQKSDAKSHPNSAKDYKKKESNPDNYVANHRTHDDPKNGNLQHQILTALQRKGYTAYEDVEGY